ncbi:MAG: NAD(P)/FAD-dependent oxidoreductase [Candidatus Cloacimonetes bacterium]|nr:NAD(P)/FAD-dependent oxidoreductase [Candidatus Cloacimonadota bacterium]
MEKVDVLVIGAGVVGLAVTENLSRHLPDVVLVEKETTFGLHTSSRNSEVIHSGVYYPPGSLKATLCITGARLIYHFAQEHQIPHQQCGKIIVATVNNELKELERLYNNGTINGVQGLRILDSEECLDLEPRIKALKALWVPEAGIINTHKLMQKLASISEDQGAFLLYDMEVTAIEFNQGRYLVRFGNGEIFSTRILINAAGLYAEQVARMAGIDTEASGLRIYWCKGEYYKTHLFTDIRHLVYPVPDPKGVFLGIHLTINLKNEIRFGPNAYFVEDLNYGMDESYKPDFINAITRYLDLPLEALHLDDCGIRAKLQGPDSDFRDFYIQDESVRNLPGFINIMGIESPGLTSALAIAEFVRNLVS